MEHRVKMLYLATIAIYIFIKHSSASECSSEFGINVTKCTHEYFQKSPGWDTRSICNFSAGIVDHEESCMKNHVCKKDFRAVVISQQLFAITMKNLFRDMMIGCCGNCAKCTVVNEIDDANDLNASLLNSSDIIFPVLGDSNFNKLRGFHYLPALSLPTAYFVTLKKSSTMVIMEVIKSCSKFWPLLVITLLFAVISGFFIWIMETRHNADEFSRRFHVGLFDGFWWSFVSMTTVGFGDKIPKTVWGRSYAILWILIGITLCSLFTATLTSEIINAQSPAHATMKGKDVAVLEGRLHDIAMVAENGGILHMVNIGHTMRGISQMLHLLKEKKINGFLIDRNTYYHFSNRVNDDKYLHLRKMMKELDMVRTEVFHKHSGFTCGFMVKGNDAYKYLQSFFGNKRLEIESCNDIRMNRNSIQDGKTLNMFTLGGVFESILLYSVALLGIIITFGVLIEGRRYYLRQKNNDPF